MFMDLCHLHFMRKNEAFIIVTPFCIVHLHDMKLNPAKHGLEKADCMNHCQVHQYNMRSKKRCHDLIAETFPQTSLMKMFRTPCFDQTYGQTVTWFLPIWWLKWIRCPATIQTHQANCMERAQYLVWWCFAIHLQKYVASNWVFPDFRTKDCKDIQPFEGTLMVACILTLSWSSTSMSSMQCCLTHKVSNWISWLVVQ